MGKKIILLTAQRCSIHHRNIIMRIFITKNESRSDLITKYLIVLKRNICQFRFYFEIRNRKRIYSNDFHEVINSKVIFINLEE